MNFHTYLRIRNININEWCAEMKISPQTFSGLINRRRKVSLDVAKKIIESTKGQVGLKDIYGDLFELEDKVKASWTEQDKKISLLGKELDELQSKDKC